MFIFHNRRFKSFVSFALILFVSLGSLNCSTLFRGSKQTIKVVTRPEGCAVEIDGMKIRDGEMVTIKKKFRKPQANVGTDRRPVMIDMDYNPDPWLIGDGALAIFWLIPGAIGAGVDFGTGFLAHP